MIIEFRAKTPKELSDAKTMKKQMDYMFKIKRTSYIPEITIVKDFD